MAQASVQHDFNLPANILWALVGDFGNMSKWTGLPPETCVADGDGIGAIRTLRPTTGGVIIDRLDAQTEWSYTYSIINIDEAPLPFASYSATLAVKATSDKSSRLNWGGQFEPKGITEAEAVAFAEAMYGRGLEMMKTAAAAKSN